MSTGPEKEIKLKRFNPKKMENQRTNPNKGPPTILLVGSKRTGKTTLIRDLMYYFRRIPAGVIMTGSLTSADTFSEFFPKSCIFNHIDDAMEKRLESIIKRQNKLVKKEIKDKEKFLKIQQTKPKSKRVSYQHTDYSSFMLFDDCGYDTKFAKKQTISQLFMNGRHYKILLIMAIQYCKSVPPALRMNADYVFVMKEKSIKERKKLHEEWFGMLTNKEFNRIMDVCTDDYGCLVLDNTVSSNKIEDQVFFYKARYPPKKYKVGTKELWDFHKRTYRSDDDSDDDNNNTTTRNATLSLKNSVSKSKSNKIPKTMII